MPPLERFYFFLGRILFPRQQDWQQARSAKTLLFVIGFSIVLALVVVKFIKILYNHSK
jgi:surface polysaccharide O-acyltransferase-like enzyme